MADGLWSFVRAAAVHLSRGGTKVVDSERSVVEGGARQVAELVVGDAGGVVGPQLNGPLARLELGVAGGEAVVAAFLPAVDRHSVLPHPDEETAAAELVGGNLVREHHLGVGVSLEHKPVEAVEQVPVRGGNGLDVVPNGRVHPLIVIVRGAASPMSGPSMRHGR